MSALAQVLEAQAVALETQAAALRALARSQARTDLTDMVDQHKSPLGNRRHRAAVQRLVAAGKPGACIVGRKHFLTPEALQAELASAPKRQRAANDTLPRKPTAVDALDRNLALLAG